MVAGSNESFCQLLPTYPAEHCLKVLQDFNSQIPKLQKR